MQQSQLMTYTNAMPIVPSLLDLWCHAHVEFQGGLNRIFGTTSKAGEAPAAVKRIVCRDDPKKAIGYHGWAEGNHKMGLQKKCNHIVSL